MVIPGRYICVMVEPRVNFVTTGDGSTKAGSMMGAIQKCTWLYGSKQNRYSSVSARRSVSTVALSVAVRRWEHTVTMSCRQR